jgi:hypothetical protein
MNSDCIVFITDSVYRGLIDMHIIEMFFPILKYDVSNYVYVLK